MTITPLRSVSLAARVTTLLGRTFPEYVPGVVHEGFRVESLDTAEPRRMFVRWHGGTPTRPVWTHGPALGREQYKAQILEVLTRAGYAVTSVPGRMDVFVDDKPHETSGPRFTPVLSDIPIGPPWLVMDLWTRTHSATADTEEEAAGKAMEHERQHTVTEARIVTHQKLWDFLERADEVLGDGLTWLRREVSDGEYGSVLRFDRLDAVVAVANALLRGDEVTSSGRMVAYPLPSGRGTAQWVPKSAAPAVGYFPRWPWTETAGQAITLLIDAGLPPVRYGEEIGGGSVMCEGDGFLVSPENRVGVHLDTIGAGGSDASDRAAEVLRAAGWRVEADTEWPGWYSAFPPGV
ncbi:hypothetical protein [Streptomyces microflavus]|uniref:hypothetical protein n=1 Tax=Streptomyces microflavus TaxID=1919 RepID=UPI0034052314